MGHILSSLLGLHLPTMYGSISGSDLGQGFTHTIVRMSLLNVSHLLGPVGIWSGSTLHACFVTILMGPLK